MKTQSFISYSCIRFLFLLTVILCFADLRAQNIKVVSNDMNGAKILYNVGVPNVETTYGDGQPFDRLTLDGGVQSHAVGMPSLPVYSRMIEIPICEDVEVEVSYSAQRTYSARELGMNHRLLPVQPHRSKSDSLPAAFVIDTQTYSTDGIYSLPLARLQVLGIARSRRLAKLSIAPIAYNPVRQEITLYEGIAINLKYRNSDKAATNKLRQYESPLYPAPNGLIALADKPAKGIQNMAPLRYLIVAHSSFRGALDEFVAWKRRQGFITTIAYTNDAEVGTTTTSIAAYLKRQYVEANESMPAPAYVLLVGDIAQIPAFRSKMNGAAVSNGHLTDLYYFTWTDDFLPDCYFGRFSANNLNELNPQIDKTLLYERYAFEDPSYLSRAIMVSGVDNEESYAYDYCDPSMDYAVARYITYANGYGTIQYYKNATDIVPCGAVVTGSSAASTSAGKLRALYSDGYGWINYSGHGLERGWVNPSFNAGHINTMNNYGKPSIMIGNCCLSNHFNSETCFGEQLLRRVGNAGAAAYIGAIKETYWDDDFYWSVGMREAITPSMHKDGAHYDSRHLGMYDRLFHLGGEPYGQWATSMGAMVYAGNMAVNEADEEPYTQYYWEIYTLMGDPSLMPWLGEAKEMPLDYAQPVSRSLGNVIVATEPYAYVSLTTLNCSVLVDAVFADANGTAVLTFDNAIADSLLQIAAFVQNRIPAYGTVQLTYSNDIRMAISGLSVHNAVAGDTMDFSFRLSNLGIDTLWFINYVLRGNPAEIQPLHTGEYLGTMAPRTSVQQTHVCRSLLNANIPDQTTLTAMLQFISDTIVSVFATDFVVSAPNMVVEKTQVEGEMEAGSTVRLCITLANRGHAEGDNMKCYLRQPFQLAQIRESYIAIGSLKPDSSQTICFEMTIDSACKGLRKLPLELVLQRGEDSSVVELQLPFYSDDFEDSTFSHLEWQMDESFPWQISTQANNGRLSARSCPELPIRQRSTLSIAISCHADDSVEFDYRTSTVEDCNYFEVQIDGEIRLKVSGESDGWAHAVLPVVAGTHVVSFNYYKDCPTTSESDGVWIDGIQLPTVNGLSIRYRYDSVCQNMPYHFFGQEIATDSVGTFFYYHSVADTSYSLKLFVLPMPQLHILTSDSSIMPGQSTFLAVTGADSYVWSTGETTVYIQVWPTDTTTYGVTGFLYGCSATDSITIGLRPLGIGSVGNPSFYVYPNPTSQMLNIEADGMRKVLLYDVRGRLLMQRETSTDSETLNLHELSNGVYFIRIVFAGQSVTQKVIKR